MFVPEEELPRFHIARVLSMGSGYFLDLLFAMYNDAIYKMNLVFCPILRTRRRRWSYCPHARLQNWRLVICKNPWGIGPKDEETADGKKLSYIRGVDIAWVITGELLPEKA